MQEKSNIPPEITWSQVRRRWTPGFENILDFGLWQGWFDIHNSIDWSLPLPCPYAKTDSIDRLLLRWVIIPWLQCEMDRFHDHFNNTRKCQDKHKVLPQGVPNHIYENPEAYDGLDFKAR